MKVKVNQEKCLGCGTCTALCPQFFSINQEGKAEFTGQAGDWSDSIMQAAQSCPVEAIIVTEDDGQVVWPQV